MEESRVRGESMIDALITHHLIELFSALDVLVARGKTTPEDACSVLAREVGGGLPDAYRNWRDGQP